MSVEQLADKTYRAIHTHPHNAHITILSPTELATLANNHSNTVRGAADHRTRRVWIREDTPAAMAIIAGHELGHLLTPHYYHPAAEETKAFLHQFRWMQQLRADHPNDEELAFYNHEFLAGFTPATPLAQRSLENARAYWRRAGGNLQTALNALYHDARRHHTPPKDQLPLPL